MQVIKWILRFSGLVVLILFQVLVINNIDLGQYVHPYIYLMFLIMLPFETPRWILMPLAFLVGLSIDMFMNTPGMHAAACVVLTFLRPYLVKFMTPLTGYEGMESPSPANPGFLWFALFTFVLVFAHHLVYFFIQTFNWAQSTYTLLKVLASAVTSTVLILILAYLVMPRKARR